MVYRIKHTNTKCIEKSCWKIFHLSSEGCRKVLGIGNNGHYECLSICFAWRCSQDAKLSNSFLVVSWYTAVICAWITVFGLMRWSQILFRISWSFYKVSFYEVTFTNLITLKEIAYQNKIKVAKYIVIKFNLTLQISDLFYVLFDFCWMCSYPVLNVLFIILFFFM